MAAPQPLRRCAAAPTAALVLLLPPLVASPTPAGGGEPRDSPPPVQCDSGRHAICVSGETRARCPANCPENMPYMFDGGDMCCSTGMEDVSHEKVVSGAWDPRACDGGELSKYSQCCAGESAECAVTPCENYPGVNWLETPKPTPAPFPAGRKCVRRDDRNGFEAQGDEIHTWQLKRFLPQQSVAKPGHIDAGPGLRSEAMCMSACAQVPRDGTFILKNGDPYWGNETGGMTYSFHLKCGGGVNDGDCKKTRQPNATSEYGDDSIWWESHCHCRINVASWKKYEHNNSVFTGFCGALEEFEKDYHSTRVDRVDTVYIESNATTDSGPTEMPIMTLLFIVAGGLVIAAVVAVFLVRKLRRTRSDVDCCQVVFNLISEFVPSAGRFVAQSGDIVLDWLSIRALLAEDELGDTFRSLLMPAIAIATAVGAFEVILVGYNVVTLLRDPISKTESVRRSVLLAYVDLATGLAEDLPMAVIGIWASSHLSSKVPVVVLIGFFFNGFVLGVKSMEVMQLPRRRRQLAELLKEGYKNREMLSMSASGGMSGISFASRNSPARGAQLQPVQQRPVTGRSPAADGTFSSAGGRRWLGVMPPEAAKARASAKVSPVMQAVQPVPMLIPDTPLPAGDADPGSPNATSQQGMLHVHGSNVLVTPGGDDFPMDSPPGTVGQSHDRSSTRETS